MRRDHRTTDYRTTDYGTKDGKAGGRICLPTSLGRC